MPTAATAEISASSLKKTSAAAPSSFSGPLEAALEPPTSRPIPSSTPAASSSGAWL